MKTSIDFVWLINYAKWNKKLIKTVIENYKSNKSDLDITSIIPNHGENYVGSTNNAFYVQNIISWAIKYKENPVRIFTCFSNSMSLVSFVKDIRKYQNNTIDIHNNDKDYNEYSQNKEFYDNFFKEFDEIFNKRNFANNLIDQREYDNEKTKELLTKFIQKKYNTDITIDKIEEECKKAFKKFAEQLMAYNPAFEIIDIRDALLNDSQAQEDIKYYEKNSRNIKEYIEKIKLENRVDEPDNNLYGKSAALNLLLKDRIFDMPNFVDTMKIMVSNYFAPNLVIDMDITPSIFNEELENILNGNFSQEDLVYFGNYEYIENQVCYTKNKNNQAFNMIFNKILYYFYKNSNDIECNNQDVYNALRLAAEYNMINNEYSQYDFIKQIEIKESRMFGESGISDIDFAIMNLLEKFKEKKYKFKENWIQDGLKYDNENFEINNILEIQSIKNKLS